MEIPQSYGIINLITTILFFGALFVSVSLLFNKKTTFLGIATLGMTMFAIIVQMITSYAIAYKMGSSYLAEILLLPLFGFSLSLALGIRHIRRNKVGQLRVTIRNSLKDNWRLAAIIFVVIFIMTSCVKYFVK